TLLLLLLFFPDPSPPETYPLSLHDALPIYGAHAGRQLDRHGQERLAVDADLERGAERRDGAALHHCLERQRGMRGRERGRDQAADRKSTRLNSSHEWISYAVFCLKKKRASR